jgi:hypothetical protein
MIETTLTQQLGKAPLQYKNKDVYKEEECYELFWNKFSGKIEIKTQIRYYQLMDPSLGIIDGNKNYLSNLNDELVTPNPFTNRDYSMVATSGDLIDSTTTIMCDKTNPNAVDQWDYYSGDPRFKAIYQAMMQQSMIAHMYGKI